jgi:formiminoglutamase
MSPASSSAGAWFIRLEPVAPIVPTLLRPDDPRLGECVVFWSGDAAPPLVPNQPVLLGFPQDEGVRRNGGRIGAAAAPAEIRRRLYSLTPWDGANDVNLRTLGLLDLGDVRVDSDLEASQKALGEVVATVLAAGAIPIVLGGGHETAFGHYLGYAALRRMVTVINLDAHLDVRPCLDGRGHSGSSFRQMLEHPEQPLPGSGYVCLGAQPFSVSRDHVEYVRQSGGTIAWAEDLRGALKSHLAEHFDASHSAGWQAYVTLDCDVFRAADVPGVSAPNPLGLSGDEVCAAARFLGASPAVGSFDVVEINPSLDRDGQSVRWAALVVWHFLVGLARRPFGKW